MKNRKKREINHSAISFYKTVNSIKSCNKKNIVISFFAHSSSIQKAYIGPQQFPNKKTNHTTAHRSTDQFKASRGNVLVSPKAVAKMN